MNLALIAYEFYPDQGGIAHVLNSFCKSFKNTEHSLYVFNQYFRGKNIYNILDKKNYKLYDIILSLKNKKILYFTALSLWKLLKDKKVSFSDKIMIILYIIIRYKFSIRTLYNIQNLYPYFKNYKIQVTIGGSSGLRVVSLIFILSRIFNTKAVCIAHGNEFLAHTPLSLRSYFYKNLDLIILGTKTIKKMIMKIHHLDDKKTKVINFGLVLDEYLLEKSKEKLRSELNIPKEQFVLLSVGRHVSRKKFDLVIKAIKKIKEINRDIDIKYYLIGEGEYTPELHILSEKLGLQGDIIFLGSVDNLTRNKFYKLSDIFIMPSVLESESIEGFGLVFLEANYFYTPVIGTHSGGIVEAIENGKSGLLVKQDDVDDLVEKILFLYNNPKIRDEIGNYGHDRVINLFSWSKNIEKFINIFGDIVD